MFPTRFSNYPDWNVWGPFREFEQFRNNINRLAGAHGTSPDYPAAGVFPLTNLSEDQDSYYVRAELPGITAEQIEITATADTLSLAGRRSIPDEGETVKYHRRERESGSFSRMIGLPGAVDPEKVDASFKNGVLTIKLPKSEAARPRQITVT